jgi:hypothetical protein
MRVLTFGVQVRGRGRWTSRPGRGDGRADRAFTTWGRVIIPLGAQSQVEGGSSRA